MRDRRCDFFEQGFGSVTLRCDLLLGNVDIWNADTGEVVAVYAGVDDIRAGLAHWRAQPKVGQDVVAALVAAETAIAAETEAGLEG